MKTMHESAAALYPSALAATLTVASASPSAASGLDGLKVRTPALVTGLVPARDGREHSTLLRLLEIGFVPGETVQVLARGAWGGDPLAVRVGQATLRCGTKRRPWCRFRRGAVMSAVLNAGGGVATRQSSCVWLCWATPIAARRRCSTSLTGARQKVANYAGVTVERKEGTMHTASGRKVRVLDLPGAYSLHAHSLDEAITRDIVRGRRPGEPLPDLLVCVTDATHLRLNLRLVLEARALGLPMVLVLNMSDMAERRGIQIDREVLARELWHARAGHGGCAR